MNFIGNGVATIVISPVGTEACGKLAAALGAGPSGGRGATGGGRSSKANARPLKNEIATGRRARTRIHLNGALGHALS